MLLKAPLALKSDALADGSDWSAVLVCAGWSASLGTSYRVIGVAGLVSSAEAAQTTRPTHIAVAKPTRQAGLRAGTCKFIMSNLLCMDIVAQHKKEAGNAPRLRVQRLRRNYGSANTFRTPASFG